MKAYKKRMVKEYHDLCDKINKLHKILIKDKAGTLDFEPDCPIYLLKQQYEAMCEYAQILEIRAEYEKIDLEY